MTTTACTVRPTSPRPKRSSPTWSSAGMFSGELDANDLASRTSNHGGTEAQDWGAMLLRMYLRYCERKGFQGRDPRTIRRRSRRSQGRVLKVTGEYAYGHLRTETAPAGAQVRSTAATAVIPHSPAYSSIPKWTTPSKSISTRPICAWTPIALPARAGQHVDETNSAVRITHVPSQHRGAVPERPFATPQPRRGDGHA